MSRIRNFLIGAALAVTVVGLAHAEASLAGKWTYRVGAADAPCILTLSADGDGTGGSIASGDNCPRGLSAVGHWQVLGSRLQFLSPSGDLVAVLHADGDGYKGKQVDGGRTVALNR
jgi:hypothetical protein